MMARMDRPPIELFRRFVGEWDVACELFSEATGAWSSSRLRWTFASILDGLGVQDVLFDDAGSTIGTTVRTWDAVALWRVVWFSPRVPEHCVLGVVEESDDCVTLAGTQADGRRIRWAFSAITADSFEWNGWCSNDDGATWWHEQHMSARRRLPAVGARA